MAGKTTLGIVVAAVVHAHQHEQRDDAQQGIDALLRDILIGRAGLRLRHDGRGGEHHHQAEQHQQQHHPEQPFIDADPLCHPTSNPV